jgi:16S rRNA pseudouridine516 synthase
MDSKSSPAARPLNVPNENILNERGFENGNRETANRNPNSEFRNQMRFDRLLSNLGYGSRREVARLIDDGRVTRADGTPVAIDENVPHSELRLDGKPVDPSPPLTIIVHKPAGFTCSHGDAGPLIYDLLPPRFARRKPPLAVAGRLDKDSSGLVIMTDDGSLLHRIISPKKSIYKTYEVALARPLAGDEGKIFSSGTLYLKSETKPCAPALLEIISERAAIVRLTEGRYHQIRRMFAAIGNHVESLHRSSIGSLGLADLPAAQWRLATDADVAAIFSNSPDRE